MTEPVKVAEQKAEPGNNAQSSAETEKTEKQEHMIPKSRLDEVLEKNKELLDKMSAMDAASKDAEEQRLADQEKWRELAEKRQQELEALKPRANVAEEQEKSLQSYLRAQIEEIPEEMRSLIPEQLTTLQKLDWLSLNRSKLLKPIGPNIGAGQQGAGGGGGMTELTAEEKQAADQFGIKYDDYGKFKDND